MTSPQPKRAQALDPSLNWALFLDVDGTILRFADTPNGVAHAAAQLGRLPAHLGRLEPTPIYHVTVSGALRSLAEEVDRDVAHARVGRPDGDGSRPDSKELDQA
jgi:hypothetical protein